MAYLGMGLGGFLVFLGLSGMLKALPYLAAGDSAVFAGHMTVDVVLTALGAYLIRAGYRRHKTGE